MLEYTQFGVTGGEKQPEFRSRQQALPTLGLRSFCPNFIRETPSRQVNERIIECGLA